MQSSVRRLVLLSTLAVALGLVGGGAAWMLIHLIALTTNALFFHRFAWRSLPSFAHYHPGPELVAIAILGGLVVALLARWAPMIKGHGIPEAMEAVLTKQSRIAPRAAVAKPVSAAVAIGTGGPFGAEGPIIVTGGALGSLMGQVLPMSPAERKILLAAGAAAGMAATFGTPIAAVVLAIELLLFEFSTRAFIPLVVASAIAAGMHSLFFGSGPLFAVPGHDYAGLAKLPFFVAMGPLCGLLAVVVTRGLFLVEEGYRKLPLSHFWHPIIGALGFAAVGLFVPRVLSVGYDVIGDVLATRLAVGTVAVILVAKLLAWWVALGSGTSGGTLAPVMLVGAAFGSLFGSLAAHVDPGLHLAPGAFAVVAMAAVFGAASRATFASIVFVFEVTQDFHIVLPLMVASVLADLVASALLRDSLMTEKLARRGLRVNAQFEADVLRAVPVSDVMTREVRTVSADAPASHLRRLFVRGGHGGYPVVDRHGTVVAMVSRTDLLEEDPAPGATAIEVASPDVVAVSPGDPLFTAMERILVEKVEHLPVIEDGRLVGICTRTDILRARERQLEHERAQPGWRPAGVPWPRRRRSA